MKVVLHIGADKCGSTAIQKTLFHNAKTLRERGIAYLAGEFILAHDGTICRMEGGERVIDGAKLRERLEIAESRNSEMLILSFEGFHTVSQRSLEEVREILGENEIQIVYYIREQADYVNSALLQRAKTNYEASACLRAHRGEWLGFTGHNYAGILWGWRKAFPGAEILVRIFDRETLIDGDVVSDFFHSIGVSMEGLVSDENVVNTSITLETAVALQTLSAIGHTEKDRGSVAIGVGSMLGGCAKLLSRRHSWMIRARNLRCNASLGRRYFGKLFPFRFKKMSRDVYEESRVLDILCETGKTLSHLPVGENFEIRKEAVSFLEQGYVVDQKGVALEQGDNPLLLRCGNWHAAELWNEITISFQFSGSNTKTELELWGQQTEADSHGAASVSVKLSEISILLPAVATIRCQSENEHLTAIKITFR